MRTLGLLLYTVGVASLCLSLRKPARVASGRPPEPDTGLGV